MLNQLNWETLNKAVFDDDDDDDDDDEEYFDWDM